MYCTIFTPVYNGSVLSSSLYRQAGRQCWWSVALSIVMFLNQVSRVAACTFCRSCKHACYTLPRCHTDDPYLVKGDNYSAFLGWFFVMGKMHFVHWHLSPLLMHTDQEQSKEGQAASWSWTLRKLDNCSLETPRQRLGQWTSSLGSCSTVRTFCVPRAWRA